MRFQSGGDTLELDCDFIAGCDGSHGMCRQSLPPGAFRVYEKTYPFAWLGILALAPPSTRELIYAYHDRGFALYSMRTPERSRLYVQCRPDDTLEAWPEKRIWSELRLRLETADGGCC